MPVSQKERALTELQSELRMISAIVAGEFGAHAIKEFQKAMQNLINSITALPRAVNTPGFERSYAVYIQNVSIPTTSYRITVLTNFERFISKLKRYLDITLLTVPTEIQREYTELYADMTRIKVKIQKSNELLDTLIQELEGTLYGDGKFLSPEKIKEKLNEKIPRIISNANQARNQIKQYSEDMSYIIDKVQALLSAAALYPTV